MFKLIKYEFQKQMFSKIVIGICLAALTLYFAVMVILDKEDAAGIGLCIMGIVMLAGMFYVAIESIVVYERDLKTKQSYMLFLVPQSAYSILGAKMLASVLQIFFTMVLYGLSIALCGTVYVGRYSNAREFIEFCRQMTEAVFEVHVDMLAIIRVMLYMFIIWVFIVMLAIFTDTLLNTVLNRSKVLSVLSVVVYIALFWLVLKIENHIYPAGVSSMVMQLISTVYYLVIDFVLFLASGWLIDKKLSV